MRQKTGHREQPSQARGQDGRHTVRDPGRPERALPGALPAHHRAHPPDPAQFAAAGHPLLGDGKYGSERQNKRYGRSYQALYSYRLEFCFTTDAGALAPLDGQQFQVEQVDFVTEYFPGFSL